MASSADPHRPSPSAPPLISIHRTLGVGKAADVLLWRRRNLSAAFLGAATSAWYLLGPASHRVFPLLADALLLAIAVLFFWAKSAAFLQRPLPPLPNLEVPDRVAEKVADELSRWFDAALGVAREIALGKDRKLFPKVVLILWATSYVGSLFNLLTWIYIGFLMSITMPALYDKYHVHIDKKLVVVCSLAPKHCGNIFDKCGSSFNAKEKKNE